MRRRSRASATAWLVATLAASGPAAAAPELTWDAPKGCPRGPAVLELVRDIVGEEVWSGATLRATGRIVETANGYRVELRMEDATETQVRSLDAKVCADLLGASAVVLGLNLKGAANGDATGETAAAADSASAAGASTSDEGVTTAPPAPPPPAKVQPAGPTRNADATAADETPRPSAQRGEDRFWLGLPRAAVGLGSLPEATWSAGAAFGVRFSEWGAWLAGRYQLPQAIHPGWSTEVGAEIRRYSAELGASRGWRTGVLEFGPQVFVSVDYLTARGNGADLVSDTAGSVVPAVGAGVFARVSLVSWLSLSGALCGEVPLARPRFVVDSLGEMGQLGVAQGRFEIGVDWKF